MVIPSLDWEVLVFLGDEVKADFMTWPMSAPDAHMMEIPLPTSAAEMPAYLAAVEKAAPIKSDEVAATETAPVRTRMDDFLERRRKATEELLAKAHPFANSDQI